MTTTEDPRTADGMTDTEVIDLVRETLGDPVAQATRAVFNAIDSVTGAGVATREKLVLTRVDNGSWQTVNHSKKSFEDTLEEKKDESSANDVEVLEVQVVRRAKITRAIVSSVEHDS